MWKGVSSLRKKVEARVSHSLLLVSLFSAHWLHFCTIVTERSQRLLEERGSALSPESPLWNDPRGSISKTTATSPAINNPQKIPQGGFRRTPNYVKDIFGFEPSTLKPPYIYIYIDLEPCASKL